MAHHKELLADLTRMFWDVGMLCHVSETSEINYFRNIWNYIWKHVRLFEISCINTIYKSSCGTSAAASDPTLRNETVFQTWPKVLTAHAIHTNQFGLKLFQTLIENNAMFTIHLFICELTNHVLYQAFGNRPQFKTSVAYQQIKDCMEDPTYCLSWLGRRLGGSKHSMQVAEVN